MKKLKLDYLFVAAMLLGGSLGVVGAAAEPNYNVFNSTPDQPTPTWTDIPAGQNVTCSAAATQCKAVRTGTVISDVQAGEASL
jgi:hypothetical protein